MTKYGRAKMDAHNAEHIAGHSKLMKTVQKRLSLEYPGFTICPLMGTAIIWSPFITNCICPAISLRRKDYLIPVQTTLFALEEKTKNGELNWSRMGDLKIGPERDE
jgi:hypothetical protein